jgi:hypothetical protein
MTLPRGGFTYGQRGQFAFNRAWLWGVDIYANHDHVPSMVAGRITYHSTAHPTYYGFIKVRDNVWGWSSNAYTMDYLIEYNYYTYPTVPTLWPIKLSWVIHPSILVPCLQIQTNSPDTHTYLPYPTAGVPYWFPP